MTAACAEARSPASRNGAPSCCVISPTVLEVGAGTGVTLAHYPRSDRAARAVRADAHMQRKLKKKADAPALRNIEISDASLDSLPFGGWEFDAVVCSLVLCSVPDQRAALAEIARVLKPGGRLVFSRARRRRRAPCAAQMAAAHRTRLEAPMGKLPSHAAHRGGHRRGGDSRSSASSRESIRKALPLSDRAFTE